MCSTEKLLPPARFRNIFRNAIRLGIAMLVAITLTTFMVSAAATTKSKKAPFSAKVSKDVPKGKLAQKPIPSTTWVDQAKQLVERVSKFCVLVTVPGTEDDGKTYSAAVMPRGCKGPNVRSGASLDGNVVCTVAHDLQVGARVTVSFDSELRSLSEGGKRILGPKDYNGIVVKVVCGLAFIEVNHKGDGKLPHIELGSDAKLTSGAALPNCLAIGKARGEFFSSLAKPYNNKYEFKRWVAEIQEVTYVLDKGAPRLLMQARYGTPVTPENDGGVLVDDEGNIIGVLTVTFHPDGRTETYAIPVSVVRKGLRMVAPSTLKGASQHELGVNVADIDKDETKQPWFKFFLRKQKEESGVVVLSVKTDSPAAKAGIQANDITLAFNGYAVCDAETYRNLEQYSFGDGSVSLTIKRGNNIFDLEVTR
ncbi:MAG: PDZ domain-containing protein [Holosporales bacterium]|jgi:hypothetical protein|nr:PDZ domain-containing protein [Holosporales bacterium]